MPRGTNVISIYGFDPQLNLTLMLDFFLLLLHLIEDQLMLFMSYLVKRISVAFKMFVKLVDFKT